MLKEAAIFSPPQQRAHGCERPAAISDKPPLDRVAKSDALWVEVNLHRAGVTGLWIELDGDPSPTGHLYI